MQKKKKDESLQNALRISCFVCAAGSFGAFFRWLQNMFSYEKDSVSYLMVPTAWTVIIPLYLVGVCVLFALLLKDLGKKGFLPPADMRSAFRGRTLVFPAVMWVIGLLAIVGGIVTLVGIDAASPDKTLLSLIGILAIASGLCFAPTCTSSKRRFSPGLVCVFMAFPVLMFCLWLIYSYKTYSTLPETWVYVIELLAICVAIFAFFFNAGYPADRAKPARSMFFSMLGATLCIMTLADDRSAGLQILMLASAVMLLAENWMLVSNMSSKEDREKKAAARKSAPAKDAPKPEADSQDESILAPGGESENEPTLEVPDTKPER